MSEIKSINENKSSGIDEDTLLNGVYNENKESNTARDIRDRTKGRLKSANIILGTFELVTHAAAGTAIYLLRDSKFMISASLITLNMVCFGYICTYFKNVKSRVHSTINSEI